MKNVIINKQKEQPKLQKRTLLHIWLKLINLYSFTYFSFLFYNTASTNIR